MSLTILATAANGQQYRLGADEPNGAWVPQNIQWTSTVPGGWKDLSFDLARRFNEPSPLGLFDEVVVIDEAGQHVYEGRIMKLPRQVGDDFQQNVQCLGWASHLLDDTSFREIYVDRDLGQWREPGWARRLSMVSNNQSIGQTGVAADPGSQLPALLFGAQGAWATSLGVRAEQVYEAPAGLGIAAVEVAWQTNGAIGTDANWIFQAYSTDDEVTFPEFSPDQLTGATTGTLAWGPTTARKMLLLQLAFGSAAGVDGVNYELFAHNVAVHGAHGLTGLYGPAGLSGYYVDVMLADALGRAAPKLNFTVGDGGSIQRPDLVIPQAAYPEAGSIDQIILDLNKYTQWSWLVYENRTFFYRPTDPDRLTWETRIADGARVNLEGDDAERVVNGCLVKYSLLDGTRRTAGPPGSGFDVEDPNLVITDPDHPVNAHGYPRKWLELDVSFPLADDLYATIIGGAALGQASLPSRSGSIELTGYARHPTKGLRPVREIRADDWVMVADIEADVPRRIVQAAYVEDDLKVSLSVGNEVDQVTAILEQVGVGTRIVTGG